MDRDTLQKKEDYRRILTEFRTGRIDILVGTQMIAKGLHFPNVTLVGVLYADLSLHVPDFRAGERTFQLLTQVSGRAGAQQLAQPFLHILEKGLTVHVRAPEKAESSIARRV